MHTIFQPNWAYHLLVIYLAVLAYNVFLHNFAITLCILFSALLSGTPSLGNISNHIPFSAYPDLILQL